MERLVPMGEVPFLYRDIVERIAKRCAKKFKTYYNSRLSDDTAGYFGEMKDGIERYLSIQFFEGKAGLAVAFVPILYNHRQKLISLTPLSWTKEVYLPQPYSTKKIKKKDFGPRVEKALRRAWTLTFQTTPEMMKPIEN